MHMLSLLLPGRGLAGPGQFPATACQGEAQQGGDEHPGEESGSFHGTAPESMNG